MKVPPKRKGNFGSEGAMRQSCGPLNESPSEKEGKSGIYHEDSLGFYPQ